MSKRFFFVSRSQNQPRQPQQPAETPTQPPPDPTTAIPLDIGAPSLPDLPTPSIPVDLQLSSQPAKKPTRFALGPRKPQISTQNQQSTLNTNNNPENTTNNDENAVSVAQNSCKLSPSLFDSDMRDFAQGFGDNFDQLSQSHQHSTQSTPQNQLPQTSSISSQQPSKRPSVTPQTPHFNQHTPLVNSRQTPTHLNNPQTPSSRLLTTTPQRITPQHRRTGTVIVNPAQNQFTSLNSDEFGFDEDFDAPFSHSNPISSQNPGFNTPTHRRNLTSVNDDFAQSSLEPSTKSATNDDSKLKEKEDESAGWMGGWMSSVNSVFAWATGTPKAKTVETKGEKKDVSGDTLSQMSCQSKKSTLPAPKPTTANPGSTTPRSTAMSQHTRNKSTHIQTPSLPRAQDPDHFDFSDSVSMGGQMSNYAQQNDPKVFTPVVHTPNRPRRNSAVDFLVDSLTPTFQNPHLHRAHPKTGQNGLPLYFSQNDVNPAPASQLVGPGAGLYASTPTGSSTLLLTPQSGPQHPHLTSARSTTSNRSFTPITTSTNLKQHFVPNTPLAQSKSNQTTPTLQPSTLPRPSSGSDNTIPTFGRQLGPKTNNNSQDDQLDTLSNFSFSMSTSTTPRTHLLQQQQQNQFQRAGIPSLSHLQPPQSIPNVALSMHSQNSQNSQNSTQLRHFDNMSQSSQNLRGDVFSTPSLQNAVQQRRIGASNIVPLFSMRSNNNNHGVSAQPAQIAATPTLSNNNNHNNTLFSPSLGPAHHMMRKNSAIMNEAGISRFNQGTRFSSLLSNGSRTIGLSRVPSTCSIASHTSSSSQSPYNSQSLTNFDTLANFDETAPQSIQNQLLLDQVKQYQSLIAPNITVVKDAAGTPMKIIRNNQPVKQRPELTTSPDEIAAPLPKKYQEFFTPTLQRYQNGKDLDDTITSPKFDHFDEFERNSQSHDKLSQTASSSSSSSSKPNAFRPPPTLSPINASLSVNTTRLNELKHSHQSTQSPHLSPLSPRQLSPSIRDSFVNEKRPSERQNSALSCSSNFPTLSALSNVATKHQQAGEYFRAQYQALQRQIQQSGQLEGLSQEEQQHLLMMMRSGILFTPDSDQVNGDCDDSSDNSSSNHQNNHDPTIRDLYPSADSQMDQLVLWQCYSFASRQPQRQIEDILSGMNSFPSQYPSIPSSQPNRNLNISVVSQLQQLQYNLRHQIENKLSNVFDLISSDWNYAWSLFSGQYSSVENVYTTVHARFSKRELHLRYLLTDVQNAQLRNKDLSARSLKSGALGGGGENPHGIITEQIPQHHEYYTLLLTDQINAVKSAQDKLEKDYQTWQVMVNDFKQQRDGDIAAILPALCQNGLKMVISAFILKSIQYLYHYFQSHTRNKNKQSKSAMNMNEIQSKLSEELRRLDAALPTAMYTRLLTSLPGSQPASSVTGGFLTPKVGGSASTVQKTPGKDPNHLDVFETISNISPNFLCLIGRLSGDKNDPQTPSDKMTPPISPTHLDAILETLDKTSATSHEAKWHINVYQALKLFICETLPELISCWVNSVDSFNNVCSLEVNKLFISHHKGFTTLETNLENNTKRLQHLYYEKYRLSISDDTSVVVKQPLTPQKGPGQSGPGFQQHPAVNSSNYLSMEEIDLEIHQLNRIMSPNYGAGGKSSGDANAPDSVPITPGVRSRRRDSFSELDHRAKSASRTSRSPSLRPRSHSRERRDSSVAGSKGSQSDASSGKISTLDDLAMFLTKMSNNNEQLRDGDDFGDFSHQTPSEFLSFVENGSPSLIADADVLLSQFTADGYRHKPEFGELSSLLHKTHKKAQGVVPKRLWFRKAPRQSLTTHQVIIDLLNKQTGGKGVEQDSVNDVDSIASNSPPTSKTNEHDSQFSADPFPQPLFKHGCDLDSVDVSTLKKSSSAKSALSFPQNYRVWSIGLVLGCFTTMANMETQELLISSLQQTLLPAQFQRPSPFSPQVSLRSHKPTPSPHNQPQLMTNQDNDAIVLGSDPPLPTPSSVALSTTLSANSTTNSYNSTGSTPILPNNLTSPALSAFSTSSSTSTNSTSTQFTSVSKQNSSKHFNHQQLSHLQNVSKFISRFSTVQIDDFTFSADLNSLINTILQSHVDAEEGSQGASLLSPSIQSLSKHFSQATRHTTQNSTCSVQNNVSHPNAATPLTSTTSLASLNSAHRAQPIPATPVLSSHNSFSKPAHNSSSRATNVTSGSGLLPLDLEEALSLVPREADNPHFFSYLSSYSNPLHTLFNPYLQFLYNTDCYTYILSQVPFEVIDWVLLCDPGIIWNVSKQFNEVTENYLNTTFSDQLLTFQPYYDQYVALQQQMAENPTKIASKPTAKPNTPRSQNGTPSTSSVTPSPTAISLLSSSARNCGLVSPQIIVKTRHAAPHLVSSLLTSASPPSTLPVPPRTASTGTEEDSTLIDKVNKYRILFNCFVTLQHNYILSLDYLNLIAEHSATIICINAVLEEMYDRDREAEGSDSTPLELETRINHTHPFAAHFAEHLSNLPKSQRNSSLVKKATALANKQGLSASTLPPSINFSIELVQTDAFINVPLHQALRREGFCKPRFKLASTNVLRIDSPQAISLQNANDKESTTAKITAQSSYLLKALRSLDTFLLRTSLSRFTQISTLVHSLESTRQQIKTYSHQITPHRPLPAFPLRFDDIPDSTLHPYITTTPSLALMRAINTTANLQVLSRVQTTQNRALNFPNPFGPSNNCRPTSLTLNTTTSQHNQQNSSQHESVDKTLAILPLPALPHPLPSLHSLVSSNSIKDIDTELWFAAHPTTTYISDVYSAAVLKINETYDQLVGSNPHQIQPTFPPAATPLLDFQKQLFIRSISRITNIAQFDELYNIYFVKSHSDIIISLVHALYNCLSTTIPNIQELPLTTLFHLLKTHNLALQSTRFVAELKKFLDLRQTWLNEYLQTKFRLNLFELPILEPLYTDSFVNDISLKKSQNLQQKSAEAEKNEQQSVRSAINTDDSKLPLHKLKRSKLDELHYFCNEPGLYLHEHTLTLLSTQYPQDSYHNQTALRLNIESQISGRDTTRARYDFTWGASFKFNQNMYRFGLHAHLCHRQGGYYSPDIRSTLHSYLFPTHFNMYLTKEAYDAVQNYIRAVLARWQNYNEQVIFLTTAVFSSAVEMNTNYQTVYQPDVSQKSSVSVSIALPDGSNSGSSVCRYNVNQYMTELLSTPIPHLLHGRINILQHDAVPLSNPLTMETSSMYHQLRPYHHDLLKFQYSRFASTADSAASRSNKNQGQLMISLNPTEPFFVYISDIFDAIARVSLEQHPSYLSRIIPTSECSGTDRVWDVEAKKMTTQEFKRYTSDLIPSQAPQYTFTQNNYTRVTTSHPLYHQLFSAHRVSQCYLNKLRTQTTATLTDSITRGVCMVSKPLAQLLPSSLNERYLVQATAPRYSIHDHENDPKSWLRGAQSQPQPQPQPQPVNETSPHNSTLINPLDIEKQREAYRNFVDSYPRNNRQIDISNAMTSTFRVMTRTNLLAGLPPGVTMATLEADIDLGLQNVRESAQSTAPTHETAKTQFLNSGSKFKNNFNQSVSLNPHFTMAINTLYDVGKLKEECLKTGKEYFGCESSIVINALKPRPIISTKVPNPIAHLLTDPESTNANGINLSAPQSTQ